MQPHTKLPPARKTSSALKAPLLGLVCLAGLSSIDGFADRGHQDGPEVYPPKSRPFGMTYGNWGAEWWRWALSTPADKNPIQDPTGENGSQGQAGPVWFLAGTFGGSAERTITIPEGKAIFFPLSNQFNDYPCPDPAFQPAPGQSLYDFLRSVDAASVDIVTSLEADVDGVQIRDLFSYRGTSGPDLTVFTADPSWVSLDPCLTPGKPQVGVSDGYWVMLKSLEPGQHTIHFAATIAAYGFNLDVTYHITVSPEERKHGH